jgi:cellulose synthase/poly-beta-1,6-N-acetylglucosamine synthase-like glycosyltransferase
MKTLFWISSAFVVYVYFGYPILLWLLRALAPHPSRKEQVQPSITLLVAAHNESDVIAAKLRNALALDYPAEKLQVVVASDGSKDNTAEIVRSIAEREGAGRIHLMEFVENRGKVATLNDAVSHLTTEIVAFSDASSMLASDSVERLAEHFADDKVGAVSGVYRLLKQDQAKLGGQEDFYWKYETFLKVQEARLGAFTGAHGSLYAIRRELYPFPAIDTINDDFIIPMRIRQRGYRVDYEPAAVAYEEAHEMEGFSRRVRITAGNIDQLREIKSMLWPPQWMSLFCLLSHKAARLVVPLAMLLLIILNVLLRREWPYGWLLVGQVLFYGLAALGALVALRPKVLRLPYYFCMINFAFFAWIYFALRMKQFVPSRIALDKIGKEPTAR